MDTDETQMENEFSLNCTKARRAIIAYVKNQVSVGGWLGCPICRKAKLFFRIEYNGHVHAVCKTDGCVAWRE